MKELHEPAMSGKSDVSARSETDAEFAERVRNDHSPCSPAMLALRRLVRACDRDRESMTPAEVRRAAVELGLEINLRRGS